MNHLNTNFDPDSFLNLDNDFTPSSTPNVRSVPMLTPQSSTLPTSAATFASSASSQSFPAPSFQYDAYHQQTGIPIGALASTFNINRASGLHYNESTGGFVMPTETLNMPLSNLDEFDFKQNPADMDFETDSPNDLPTMFFPDQSSSQNQFVSPNTLVDSGNSRSAPVQRIYPGMHSQQAAQAKAQQAQKQEQMARMQQQRPTGQKSLPIPSPTKTPLTKDPLVEESISKVLNRMRQASVVSQSEEDASVSGISGMPKIKKDEDDMDDDERLLASEEGKKLSSKERRQLRNKVSARAFRSRRKGKFWSCRWPSMFFVLTVRQNISANWKARLLLRHRKQMNYGHRTSNSGKRTLVSPISPACYSPLRPSLVSCKSRASPVSRRQTLRSTLKNKNLVRVKVSPSLSPCRRTLPRTATPNRCTLNNLK